MKFRKRPVPSDAKQVMCQDFEAKNNNCGLYEFCGNRKGCECDGIFFQCIECKREFVDENKAMVCCYDKKHPE